MIWIWEIIQAGFNHHASTSPQQYYQAGNSVFDKITKNIKENLGLPFLPH